MRYKTILVRALAATLLVASANAFAYEPSWEGNHPEAKSEAWTWMGHLREVNSGKLGAEGLGFIYYYTRNDTTGAKGSMGQMNFRSTGSTRTVNGEGKSYKMGTVYTAKRPDAELRARTGVLDLEFNYGREIADKVEASPMTASDAKVLAETLKLYPGVNIAPNFKPKKTIFHVTETDGTVVDLTFYSIWPALSAPEGKMEFLGQKDTYSYSDPMMVTVGTYGGKKMAGLSFLDRQWAKEYYGTYMMDGMKDLLRYAESLKYAHSWSAFHVKNQRTGEYSFFHLWNQFRRRPGLADEKVGYSGLLYARAGVEYGMVDAKDYSWIPSGFVQHKGTKVVMDYAQDRIGFFPTKASFASSKFDFNAAMWASPHLQVLDQPIYFYEGYAEGTGTWRGDKITVQGRLESSRLFFREQDYEEMIGILGREKGLWKQPELAQWMRDNIDQKSMDPFRKFHEKMLGLVSMFSEMGLKL
ncbi:MAG: hypothetical protein EOP11_17705, partial [Proteobacteria bacterium]